MKFTTLQTIGHNIADSLGSGIGLMIGVYDMDIYGEAAASPEGYIEVNFLTGVSSGGKPSQSLAKTLELYRNELPRLCRRHGVDVREFCELTARFSGISVPGGFIVTVEDRQGRRSVDEYLGSPGKRVRVLDDLGRVHRK